MFTRAPFRASVVASYGPVPVQGCRRPPRARRRTLALTGALLASVLVGALPGVAGATPPSSSTSTSAPTTTTPTTPAPAPAPPAPPPPGPTTTLPPMDPPPPPFEMGYDAGLQLVDQLDQSQADIKLLEPQVPVKRKQRDRLQKAWNRLLVRLDETRADMRRAQKELDKTHARLEALAADAYASGGGARVAAAVGSLLDANSLVDASRDLLIIDRYGSRQVDVARSYVQQKRQLASRLHTITTQRDTLRRKLDGAIAAFEDVTNRLAQAHQLAEDSLIGIAKFEQLAVNSASPILGPNKLTAEDLAAFVTDYGHQHPQLSVPIEDLAKLYIEESNDAGVRGDVAWAQSILETGWFSFSHSMVDRLDNNYAGIGACDSCSHGLVFPDARTGVRVQMQALRIYVDPDYGPDNAKHPIVRPGLLKLGFRGKVHSWFDLTGKWATARNYGPRVYDIYLQMVAFADARHEAQEAAAPAPPPSAP
jgi:mannosyl-glycoprotein endo-beta-N-acetylglucosaminidase